MIFKFSVRNLNFSCWETLEGIRQVVSDGKESACNAGDLGYIPGWKDPPGDGNGNPLQYSCLKNPMGREAWQATVLGVAKSQKQLNN